jgi:hypothetical protein
MDIYLVLAAIIIILLFIILYILLSIINHKKRAQHRHIATESDNATCGSHTCGALDPVNDPDYNMRNIAKQSILLEEHLAEKNKYCIGCIIKHFLHIIGLAEEGVWLAGKDLDKFPLLESSPGFYQTLLTMWQADKHNEELVKEILSSLRERRRNIIDHYF